MIDRDRVPPDEGEPDKADSDARGRPAPFDRLLDLGVFAPIGLAVRFRSVMPELADAGRRQIEFSRSLGRAAINAIARGLDRRSSPSDDAASTGGFAPTAPKAAAPEPGDLAPEPADEPGGARLEAEIATPVEGYDAMTAREIIALVPGCDDPTLAWIDERERAGKNRVTVLRAVGRARSRR